MDQLKESLEDSLPMQQQQQQQTTQLQQQQQQKLKKKSKNKKKSSRNEAATTTMTAGTSDAGKDMEMNVTHCSDSQQDLALTINRISEKLKQHLQLGENKKSDILDNISKAIDLVKEKCVNTNACPNKTNAIDSLQNGSDNVQIPSTKLNGHHEEEQELSKSKDDSKSNDDLQLTTKKSKRKPNNKKNPTNTIDNLTVSKENGHCPPTNSDSDRRTVSKQEGEREREHIANGFVHESKNEDSKKQQLESRDSVVLEYDNKTAMIPEPIIGSEQNVNIKKEKEDQNKREKSSEAVDSTLSLEKPLDLSNVHIEYKEYESELQMHDIMRLIQAELSEPYSIYTYRYFIYNWPKLCFLAAHGNEYVGAIVCKLGMHLNGRRGYIAMLAVRKEYRKLKIGTTLVQKAIEAMLADKADEVVLETEMSNIPALRLYENLGFVRDKRLFRYYLNGVDALRLKLWFR